MPVAYLDLPSGLGADTKKKLVKEVADSIHRAYMIPDTRVFLREWPAEQMSVDGQFGSPMRPICDFVVPPGLPIEAKRQLVKACQLCDCRGMQPAARGGSAPKWQESQHEMGTRLLQ